ncbi:heme ABC transporter ATP-binding protein [Buchananella hordeovulneris]|uniref:ABC transporter ATP-binding protein n=1 Tax=Buchananella hordeovulneris TaxID=52770 RepID=A0A1Q5PXD2_9ACTO|nr:heme ABC transporter ATP-binding protein [Buchananella hordeovulneris]OKL52050.1 ABC transporter ATP-binding protein [Buchananella hordeovulneris]
MSEQSPWAVQARDVSFAYGKRQILAGANLAVEFGEVVGLLGPNGAGKSTLVGVLSGDLEAAGGQVEFSGRPLSAYGRQELARIRSVMPQQSTFPFAYFVRDIVAMGRRCWPADAARDEEIVGEAMERTDVAHLADREVTRLSGGEKARVTFARVLTQQAGVVFLDEPTAALDISHQERIMEICRSLAAQGHAVVAVMHELQLAAAYCDRVALLEQGVVAACGAPREVLTGPTLSRIYDWPIEVMHLADDRLVVLPERKQAR